MNDKIIGRNPVLEAIRSGRSVDKILVKRVSTRGLYCSDYQESKGRRNYNSRGRES